MSKPLTAVALDDVESIFYHMNLEIKVDSVILPSDDITDLLRHLNHCISALSMEKNDLQFILMSFNLFSYLSKYVSSPAMSEMVTLGFSFLVVTVVVDVSNSVFRISSAWSR